jgi:8-oxo-dGTP pyrophosphatase MutT (NUDIX family)
MNLAERGTNWLVHPIMPDLQVRITRAMPALPEPIEQQVAAIWAAAQATNPTLFNGLVFSADRITPTLIEGHWTEYRRTIAQIRTPDLAATLSLRPLAVCGVLLCHKAGQPAVLFGRRSGLASYMPGQWQMPPAGSVDISAAGPAGLVDLASALFGELQEEVGLGRDQVCRLLPLCAVEHPGAGVVDVGFLIETALEGSAVLAAQARCGNAEYADLCILTLDEIPLLTHAWGTNLVPTAHHFLQYLPQALAQAD